MEESKSLDHQNEFPNIKTNKETIETNNAEQKLIANSNNEFNEKKDLKINPSQKVIDTEDNKKLGLTNKSNTNINELKDKIKKDSKEIIQEKTLEVNKPSDREVNLKKSIDQPANKIDRENIEIVEEKKSDDNKKVELNLKSKAEIDKTKIDTKPVATTNPIKAKTKPVKEPPIEKKPFLEFVNDYLIPEIKNEFKLKGKEVNKIYLQETQRPIAEDICWVIYCEITDTCNFWLSFEKDDITSLKSFSLCKNYEKPSIIESFLIDEKKITLKLIISRILQRLNGQKLIGAN
tara:strand:- start:191 stop:1063 length:873 start_codon:yes stop_codon:yes gene_type:complete